MAKLNAREGVYGDRGLAVARRNAVLLALVQHLYDKEMLAEELVAIGEGLVAMEAFAILSVLGNIGGAV
jgi:hypothetical protein